MLLNMQLLSRLYIHPCPFQIKIHIFQRNNMQCFNIKIIIRDNIPKGNLSQVIIILFLKVESVGSILNFFLLAIDTTVS